MLIATFDLDAIATERAAWGLFRDRRPDMYGALLRPTASQARVDKPFGPDLDEAHIRQSQGRPR